MLKIVDPAQKSGTLEEFGMAYVGFAPFEIAAAILAPIAIIAGLVWLFGGVALTYRCEIHLSMRSSVAISE